MLKLILITNQPAIAALAAEQGVQRVMVDLEILGKQERQGHRDTVISGHSMEDVARVREALADAELIVRVNPLHADSAGEIDRVIALGADTVMLPMFTQASEVQRFCQTVDARARTLLLLETAGAADALDAIVELDGVDEVYIGLNDLHLELHKRFMFELLADGTVARLAGMLRGAGIPFGFGGIARIGEGALPAEYILGEHVRLGSSSVILSRTFHRRANSVGDLHASMDFGTEIGRLRAQEERFRSMDAKGLEDNRQRLLAGVAGVLQTMRSAPC